ncbi:MAG: hypothetical protein EBV16_04740 [Betaproteobacteria bacterium]|nr:TauD/TfdA family dioxygenase [Pseudomonadota bacterium]NBO03482.1 hypothetical protein [Betaproteobacteria bacterium]NBO94349.1 hypothetical protein [Betaproteobacteria bacterium]NBP34661.1 hypothetical protein [Betaproteobacteria bacterium]NBP38761.1 hypothetical protein [Betaproteobacteria bacterium]
MRRIVRRPPLSESSFIQEAGNQGPPVKHPLVQRHPVTGRASLFLSPHTMVRLDGLAAGDRRRLLDDLISHSTQAKYVYRHIWLDHDVIMWNNRCTMQADKPFGNITIKRVLHRV